MVMVEAKRDRLVSYDCVEMIDNVNLLAYDRLADEYDDFSHLNTRKLENASIHGFRKLRNHFIPFRNSPILEIGCGTGALTQVILGELNINNLDAIDISKKMIEVSKKKIHGANPHNLMNYYAFSILQPPKKFLERRYSLVFCGLADPYLVERAFRNISEIMVKEGLVFFSLPEKNFALKEWRRRSGTPENRIRFKLRDKSYVESYSFTYELADLRRDLLEYRLQIIKYLTLDSIEQIPGNHVFSEGLDDNLLLPHVLCVLARKK
jgi:SAM-dependent methyltransferase